ncbi:GDP-mannose 4,6-dehydratase [Pochonia chlamydosporia 170]|uniref:GDP-mannose 4,6-dehydratase n=1 Tax=Pochonia chlamydosporia 170 TaxID=1380566 RepID=A0A179F461_METCM|nr:GDP-mannose 4,6-dehydratase [Pochonia chlamydosporia 170]OAQ60214.1 GDP-mannose 4,6-dehydratase [Pochonia chlamydosporia 170]
MSKPCDLSALISGINGQDGFYLSRHLLQLGYRVYGLMRGSLNKKTHLSLLIKEYGARLTLHSGDVLNLACLIELLNRIEVDEIYHLAAQSHVGLSFQQALYTYDVNSIGTIRLLEALQALDMHKRVRFYNACSSEVFGRVTEIPQKETTPFRPVSPYGASKVLSYWATKLMREQHDMFAVNGILFNHESPLRDEAFVTRKITLGVARIAHAMATEIQLGYLDSERDWTHAADMVVGIHHMMQQQRPDDFVLASGTSRSVRCFAEAAFKVIGIELRWQGEGENEVGYDARDGTVRVRVNSELFRPLEVEKLLGDPAKAAIVLKWQPTITFENLVKEMVEADLQLLSSTPRL